MPQETVNSQFAFLKFSEKTLLTRTNESREKDGPHKLLYIKNPFLDYVALISYHIQTIPCFFRFLNL